MSELSYKIPPTPDVLTFISLAAAKKQLRLDAGHDFEDEEITGFIRAAVDEAERYMDGVIIERDITFGIAAWVEKLNLPVSPISVVKSIKYLKDGNTNYTTADSDQYGLYPFSDAYYQVLFKAVLREQVLADETPDAVRIETTAGWEVSGIPHDIKKAVLLLITDAYEYRGEKEIKINRSSRALLRPFKNFS